MSELTTEDRRAFEANVWKAYVLHFLIYFQLWWSIWVLYLSDLRGFSLTQITVLEALFWTMAILAEIPTGAIADRFGRKTSLALGAGLSAVGVLVFGLATSYWIIVVAYVAWAAGTAAFSGAEYALLFESLKAVGREREFQQIAGRFGAIFPLAALAGGIAGAPIAAATDLSVPILLSAAVTAPGVLVALSMREPPLPEGEARLAYGFLLRESARTATRMPAVRSMLLLSAAITALTFGPMIFMQPFLAGHGVDVAFIGIIQSPVRLVAMAGALLAAWTTLRVGTRGAFAAAPLVIAGSYLLLGMWDSTYAFLAFPLIAGANSLLLVPATDYLNQRIPSNQRATILSLRTMLVSLGAALLEPGLGVVADATSVKAVFWVTAGVAAIVLPLALGLWIAADLREGGQPAESAVPAPG